MRAALSGLVLALAACSSPETPQSARDASSEASGLPHCQFLNCGPLDAFDQFESCCTGGSCVYTYGGKRYASYGEANAACDAAHAPDDSGAPVDSGPLGDAAPADALTPLSDGATPDTSKLVIDLSPAEQAAVCDWSAQQYGGYGHMAVCDAGARAGSSSGPGTDQAMCVMALQHLASIRPTCTATVGDAMACSQWEIQNPCAGTAAGPAGCQVLGSPACAQ
jgi:hypothetical protein